MNAAARAHTAMLSPELARSGVTRVTFETGYRWKRWKHDFSVLVDDGRGPLAVTYPFGRGRVTALIDEAIFRNDEIVRPDRARFAYALAAPGRPNGLVAFDETRARLSRRHALVGRSFRVRLRSRSSSRSVRFSWHSRVPRSVSGRRSFRSTVAIDRAPTSSTRSPRSSNAGRPSQSARSTPRVRRRTRSRVRSVRARTRPPDAIAARHRPRRSSPITATMLDVTANGFADDRNLVRGVALAQRLRKEFATHGRPRN
jgi:hypothetical protein